MSSLSATYTFAAPYSASVPFTAAAVPGLPITTALGSPTARAAVSSSRVAFLTAPSAESTRTRTSAISGISSDELLGCEEVGDLHAALAIVLHDLAGLPRRGDLERDHLRRGVGQAHLGRVEAEVGGAEHLDRLALGGHDALERRVPRLVDLLDDADDRGRGRLYHVVAGLAEPLDGDGRAVDRDLARLRQLRDAEHLGQHGRHDRHPGVGGLGARDHDVPFERAERLGDHLR